MKIEGNTIIFKSVPDMFADERDGIKPNTIRVLNDEKAQDILNYKECIKNIKIVNSINKKEFFIRELPEKGISNITDVMKNYLKARCNVFVFSWKHEND